MLMYLSCSPCYSACCHLERVRHRSTDVIALCRRPKDAVRHLCSAVLALLYPGTLGLDLLFDLQQILPLLATGETIQQACTQHCPCGHCSWDTLVKPT